jgi:uncharacterized protein (UPF0128 family)
LKLTITNLKQFATKHKLDQVKLNISSIGMKKELIEGKNTRLLSFPKMLSPLQNLQIVDSVVTLLKFTKLSISCMPLTISP